MKSKQLTAYLAEGQRAPFSWPGANCCHFAAQWVQRVEGRDTMAGLPETPSRASALRLQRRRGGLRAMVSQQLGREAIAAIYAQLGDLVLMPLSAEDPEEQAMGICVGNGLAAFVTEFGDVAYMAVTRAECAWRVGECC